MPSPLRDRNDCTEEVGRNAFNSLWNDEDRHLHYPDTLRATTKDIYVSPKGFIHFSSGKMEIIEIVHMQ